MSKINFLGQVTSEVLYRESHEDYPLQLILLNVAAEQGYIYRAEQGRITTFTVKVVVEQDRITIRSVLKCQRHRVLEFEPFPETFLFCQ